MDEFEELFRSYRAGIERFVKFRLPSLADAEDVLQEVAMTACKKFSQLKNKDAFRAWILNIARNKCNDYFRQKAKALEIPLEAVPEQLPENDKLVINGVTYVEWYDCITEYVV